MAILVSIVLAGQVAVQIVWTADGANEGPSLTILQLSGDEDTDWAVNDLLARLRSFIVDDPFIQDRIRVVKTGDPYDVLSLDTDIIVYMSHGGPRGIVTGSRLTSWKTMADIVTNSDTKIHLFAACASRNIIRYGNEDSRKQLYTVPGSRPAEVTNVEITATIMLAMGIDSDSVEEYRTDQLTRAKELVQSSTSVHIMDFSQIILDEIEAIDETYDSTWTDDFKVYRVSELLHYDLANWGTLPSDLLSLISLYYGAGYSSDGGYTRTVIGVDMDYTMNYYINSTYVIEEGDSDLPLSIEGSASSDSTGSSEFSDVYSDVAIAAAGHWENATRVFTGGTYAGYFKYNNVYNVQSPWTYIMINVTASGAAEYQVDNIHLEQLDVGGIRVDRAKVDGVWQDAVADRTPGRTGGLWIDAATSSNYEYDPMWPNEGGTMLSSWQYRKSHQLAGGSGGCTDYQIRVIVRYGNGVDSGENVYCNSRCQTDFDDIRFTLGDGNTLLDHWREYYVASSYAVFWVEVAGTLEQDSDETTTIYMYYGNSAATSASNGAATFIQFDDFDDATISDDLWGQGAGGGTIAESGGVLTLSVAAGANGDWWGGTIHYAPIVYTNVPEIQFAVVTKLNSYTVNAFTHAGIMVYNDRDNAYLFGRHYSTSLFDWSNGYRTDKIIGDVGYLNVAGSTAITTLNSLLRLTYTNGRYDFDISYDVGLTWTDLGYESTLFPQYVGLFAKEWGSSSVAAPFDYWYMRKVANAEPTHSTWGSEEYMNLDSWGYRKLHTITGSGGAGTNYQIRIVVNYGTGTDSGATVHCNSHSQTDFDDIRFTDATGSVLLDHWRESYVGSSYAVFWVEVTEDLGSSRNIYIYYGNPSAASASNGGATFIQFDDFNDNVVSGSWTQSKPVGTITEQWGSSMVISIGSAVNGDWWGGTTEYAPIAYRAAPTGSYAAVTKLSTYTVNLNTHAGIMAYTSRDNAYLWGRYYGTTYNGYKIEKIIADAGSSVAYYSSTQMGTELRVRDIGSIRYYDISLNSGGSWTNVYSTTQLDPSYVGLFAKEFGSSTIDAIFDFWYVRKCIVTEPAHGSWGAEESFSPTGQGTIQTTGEYLYVSGIPTGAGWHGPTFLQTLPSYFTLADFGLFSVNMSLFHGGDYQRKGGAMLYLYDDMMRPVFGIGLMDWWDTNHNVQPYTTFYTAAGTTYPYSWSLLSGDVNRILSIRYDPSLGLRVKISGQSEHQLLAGPLFVDNPDRTIKYVGVNSDRYTTFPEHDERIYSVMVSYCRSQLTSYYDACLTNSSFYQSDAFGIADVKEDAEDGDTSFWEIYDDSPAGAGISNVPMGGDRAICLQGTAGDNGYRYPNSASFWNERSRFVIQWSMNYSETYHVFISVDTTAGHRYLDYTAADSDTLGTGEYVHHGLGTTSIDGRWHTFQRDLAADLYEAQPTVNIVDINAFLIRGSGYIDDIKLLWYATVKEDAEDGRTTGWGVAAGTGTISNVLNDEDRAIRLQGSGMSTCYKYPYADTAAWNDAQHLLIRWSMKYSETYRVYVTVDTAVGRRCLTYDPVDYDDLGTDEYVYHGLGSDTTDGLWHTFERDLLADLREAQPTVDIINVDAFWIRGSGYIDDIMLLTRNSDAQLTVPAGASYLTTTVEARPSYDTWHGPTFVQALDRPFRLYQLREFSVRGGLVQASSSAGKTLVGLFDSQMKCIMWNWWYDNSPDSAAGRMRTAYYPETGGELWQDSPATSSSFTRTGAMWYDRDTNSIRSAIDGAVVTLGEVANASRIVSYLVIMTQRYDDVSLIDMRIHEISVVANVRATAPWMPETPPDEEPAESAGDGTTIGSVLLEGLWVGETLLDNAWSLLQLFWTGPWPELNYQYSSPANYPAALTMTLHVAVSLLHEITVVVFTVAAEMMTLLDDFQDEIMEGLLEWVAVFVVAGIALAAWRSVELSPYAGFGTLAVAIVFSLLAAAGPCLGANYLIENGWSAGTMAGMLFLMAIGMLFASFGDIVLGYLGVIAVGLFNILIHITPYFCTAFQYLCAVAAGSIIAKIFELLFAVAWMVTAHMLLTYGRIPLFD